MTYQVRHLLHKNLLTKQYHAAYLLAAAIGLGGFPSLSWGQAHMGDPEAKEKAAEVEWQLPAPPDAANLLRFYVSLTTHQSFAIDAKSLTVDTDGVIRYTIVGTSSGGAKNVSYEGIRCSSFEKRIYALGHADGTWVRARDSEWQPIPVKAANLQHAELAENYFCKNGLVAGKADQILQTIHYHKAVPGQM